MKGLIAGTLIAASPPSPSPAAAASRPSTKPPCPASRSSGPHTAKGFWGDCFVIQYPRSFKLHPGRMGEMWHRPDEASFTSPDGTAEFYVLNPSISEDDRRPKCLPDPKTRSSCPLASCPAPISIAAASGSRTQSTPLSAPATAATRVPRAILRGHALRRQRRRLRLQISRRPRVRQVPPRLRPLPPLHHPLGRLIPFQGRRFLRLNSGAQEAAWSSAEQSP